MEHSFWKARWAEKKIGFHEGRANTHLEQWWPRLGVEGRGVFVPLCGKAEDLAWLAERGHAVVGVELVESAVQEFFSEHGLSPTVERVGALTRYVAGGVTIFAGDYFALTREHLAGATAFYDRAANIALPPELRERYVKHLRALMPSGSRGLLVTIEYDQSKRGGPPFSIAPAETLAAYAGAKVELKHEQPAGGAVAEVGAKEHVFELTLAS